MKPLIRHLIALTAAGLAAVVVVAPAQAQRERLSLAERVERLEAGMGGDASPEDRQTLTELVLRLNQMEQEIRALRGLVEEQTFEIDNLKANQRDQYLDLDRRLSQILGQGTQGGALPASGADAGFGAAYPRTTQPSDTGGGLETRFGSPDSTVTSLPPAETLSAPTAATTQPADSGVVPLEGEVPEVRQTIDAGLQTSGIGEAAPVDVAALADPEAERAAYNEAFDALKGGRYAEAARLFANYLDRFPAGEYADNAQYWLGESYYVTGNYRIALESFQSLLNRYPDSAKAADAKLKLGYTYFSLQEWRQAEQVLKEVIAQFPNSTVSRLAENRLRTMRIQGHIQ
jgi:tol-pal system protein YbgF